MSRIGIGIDIGHGSVKIIQIARNQEQLDITAFAKLPLPADSIKDAVIQNQTIVSETIRHAVSKIRLQHKKVNIAVAGGAVSIQHLNLPVMLGPELSEVIKLEVGKYLPFSINEAEYDWDILRQHRERGEMELMVVAAERQVIQKQLECIKKAGLQAVVVDTQPLAILRSMGIGLPQQEENLGATVVLDMGAALTQIMIFYQESPRIIRNIAAAGNEITQMIASQLRISPEKAEAIKCNLGDADYNFGDNEPSTESYQANQIIKQKLNDITEEIRNTIEGFRSQYHRASINELILTGGSSKLRNIKRYLEYELGIAVHLADPLANLRLNMKQNDRSALLGNPFQFSVAIGLALRGVE